ncbi:hypothetical protein C8Q79DRAFT_1006672 [Trametes meyenii]|nr:hypothetical protein C8Q79DRAFT_1006672 [Trametes meyenii]
MANVTDIPTEIWRVIIPQACTDGGFTGRSLALTSKYFHSQSLAFRFHSVMLSSLGHLERFLKLLDNQPKDCKSSIEHLYLSFHDEPIRMPPAFWAVYNRMSPEQKSQASDSAREARAHWTTFFRTAWRALMTIVAPTLRTFVLIVRDDAGSPLILDSPCDFPRLEELTWMGSITGFDGVTHPTRFPALTHVHCISPRGEPVPWATTSLSLTHVRISCVGQENSGLHHELAAAIGVPDAWVFQHSYNDLDEYSEGGAAQRKPLAPATHSQLRHIVVHGVAPMPGPGGFVPWYWNHVYNETKRLAWYCEAHLDGVQVVVMEGARQKEHMWRDRLLANWLERMQGGRGCWIVAEEEEEEDAFEVFYTGIVTSTALS